MSRTAQLKAHEELAEHLFDREMIDQNGKPLSKIFHQLKYHGTPEEADKLWSDGQCFLQLYNVFWDTTGHEDNGKSSCYTCDSITVLSEEHGDDVTPSERKFNSEKWGTVDDKNVSDLYEKPVKPYFDPRKNCSACLFMKNNQVVKSLIQEEPTSEQISSSLNIKHVNFP